MRGYVTRGGIGMLLGVASLALAGAALTAQPDCRTRSRTGEATVGPFRMTVERFELHEDPQGRPLAVMQLHLWRPAGPVPLPDRVPVDGTAFLSGAWEMSTSTWLIRNELMQRPEGRAYQHAYLGAVPATHHAGEARAVLEFVWACPGTSPPPVADFALQLPQGQVGCLADLRAVRR